ncbi:3'-5' exonuclease [Kiloniella litopenaei]|uniref:3'-5' exonuclease n=1 Tax=Kiloniella litopenaei TaxID=1549748 RepID=A0A0M2R824_9PROT|nr:3'-5' exonuclease [Kiloniella litopenaei]
MHLHQTDLPDDIDFGTSVAVDSETMGLNLSRDRLCLIQLSAGDGVCHLVQFKDGNFDAPNLRALFTNQDVTKIFHFARFDLAAIERYLGVTCNPVYCTKIASKLIRTYTDRHGLKELCKELLSVDISKQQQSSDWGSPDLSEDQLRYAASDVLYLHRMVKILDERLAREGRSEMAKACFDFLPWRAKLDIAGWDETDIFAHS